LRQVVLFMDKILVLSNFQKPVPMVDKRKLTQQQTVCIWEDSQNEFTEIY
jgi:hypothetical protein